MNASDWIGIAALSVAPTGALVGVIFQLGQLKSTVTGLDSRVGKIEDWIRNRANGVPRNR